MEFPRIFFHDNQRRVSAPNRERCRGRRTASTPAKFRVLGGIGEYAGDFDPIGKGNRFAKTGNGLPGRFQDRVAKARVNCLPPSERT